MTSKTEIPNGEKWAIKLMAQRGHVVVVRGGE